MGKKDFVRNHWHVLIISLGITALSLLSWIETARVWQSENAGAASSGENPAFVLVDNFTSRVTARFEDGIVGNWHLSRLDNIYTYFTTGDVISRQVILGKENWLFFKYTAGDFDGTSRYSEDEIQDITNTAARTQSVLADKGIRFAIMVGPNKGNIYSEYMPGIYHHADVSRTDILIDHMRQNHVNIVSPKEELLENHLKYQLYYSYDTHWNQLGGYLGVKSVLASWGIDMPALADREITSAALKGNYHTFATDDLAVIIGMRSIFDDETEYEVTGTCPMDWDAFSSDYENRIGAHFSNPNAKVDGKVLLVGDSFSVAMIPSLREAFSEVYVIHSGNYAPELLETIEPDYLIAVYVERCSSDIGKIDFLIE